MKKIYTKPDIVFDSFSLSVSIAGGCGYQNSLQSEDICGVQFGDEVIFLIGVTGCAGNEYTTDDGTSGLCYHVPSDENRLFNS